MRDGTGLGKLRAVVEDRLMAIVVLVLVGWWGGIAGAQTTAPVKSVTVQFADGTEQRIEAASLPKQVPPATTRAAAGKPMPILGVNLEAVKDFSRSFMFIDAMRSARQFGSPEKPFDKSAKLDAEGWPVTDAGTQVITEAKNINGVYRFFASGRCDLSASPAVVRNLVYNERANRTMAEVVVNQPANKVVSLTLSFRNTGNGLRNIKLLRPGYDSDVELFTREFLRAVEPFDGLRCMDLFATNNSELTRWEDRAKITDATWTTTKGVPYEVAIELANRSGKDLWINVPALADDAFVTELGKLVRERLRADLVCYVEYSNEVWNGQFKQFKQNQDLAKAEVAAGEKTLDDGGKDSNQYHWAWRRVAKRSIEIRKLMGPADGTLDARLRFVLASQVGYAPPGTMLKSQLEYVAKNFGPPADYFYAVAGAPYVSLGKEETDPTGKLSFANRPDLTVEAICERVAARVGVSHGPSVSAFHALAKQYGLKSFAYEAGLDLQQFANGVDAKVAAQADPRMGAAIEQYLSGWYEGGGDGLFYFNLSGRYNKFGYWGLTDDVRDLGTPKFMAAKRVAEKLKPTAP